MSLEMQERPASATKRPHYVRAGSKDSMEVSFIDHHLFLDLLETSANK